MRCGARCCRQARARGALLAAWFAGACAPATAAPPSAPAARGEATVPAPPDAAPTAKAPSAEQPIPGWVRHLLPGLEIVKAPEGFALVKAPTIVITPENVVFQGHKVASVAELVARGRVGRVDSLYLELEKTRAAYVSAHPHTPFPGVVLFWIDKRVPELAIKDVTQTTLSAGFSKGSLVVRDEAAPDHFTRLGPGRGNLPPEVIQRIIRAHYDKFRYCYEKGLAKDPKLTGKVVVRFVIERDGHVDQVTDDGSTLADNDAVQCIFAAYRKLVFPKPSGGIVTVIYPIMFSPG